MSNPPELGTRGKTALALSLTAVGGFVDAVGYIALFQIFTANMSGNSIHIGMFLAQQDWAQIARYLWAVFSYIVGMLVTRIAVGIAGRTGRKRIASLTLAVEAMLLAIFANARPAMHLGQVVDQHSAAYFLLIALLAFAMGIQTATLTRLGALTIYTTFVTGTLTKFTESLARALFWTYDEVRQTGTSHVVRHAPAQRDFQQSAFLISTWCCYILGAALGTILKSRWELRALYLPVVLLLGFVILDQLRPFDVQDEAAQTG